MFWDRLMKIRRRIVLKVGRNWDRACNEAEDFCFAIGRIRGMWCICCGMTMCTDKTITFEFVNYLTDPALSPRPRMAFKQRLRSMVMKYR